MTTNTRPDVPEYQIFPAIGVARVGDSRQHTYIASEAPLIDHVPRGGYRGQWERVDGPPEPSRPDPPVQPGPGGAPGGDALPGPGPAPVQPGALARRIKRMGCRFRIFKIDPVSRTPEKEIDATMAEITWTVELVNKKALGDAEWGYGEPPGVLNPQPTASPLSATQWQEALTLEARGEVSGFDQGPVELVGEIRRNTPQVRPVKLGDLTTDGRGRLVVYGGHGEAASWLAPAPAPDLVRNPGWYDDTSDGIVRATVTIGGDTYEALDARIVVGPPDYAHPCLAPVTLFDIAYDRSHQAAPPTSFTEHIHPILHRSAFLEWTLFGIVGVTHGRTPKHGHGYTGGHDMHPDGAFLDPRVFDTLLVTDANHPDFRAGQDRRELYFRMLKLPTVPPPHGGVGEENSMPAIEGLTFTPVQYGHFAQLASGLATMDWPAGRDPADLAQIPFGELLQPDRPAAMNRAAMDFAVGGPFLPGVEIGEIAADPATYFLVGMVDPDIDFRVVDTIPAGDLTQSLAVPWQTAFNQHNYQPPTGDTADNVWPSARPVLMPAKRGGTNDDTLWTRPLTQQGEPDKFENQKLPSNLHMIAVWSQLGFLRPATFYIEDGRTWPEDSDFTM